MNGMSHIIILADGNVSALRELALHLEALAPENEYLLFSAPEEVKKYLGSARADMLMAQTVFPGTDGYSLMEAALDAQPWLKTALIGSSSEDAVRAMRCKADGFILKPVTDEKLLSVLTILK